MERKLYLQLRLYKSVWLCKHIESINISQYECFKALHYNYSYFFGLAFTHDYDSCAQNYIKFFDGIEYLNRSLLLDDFLPFKLRSEASLFPPKIIHSTLSLL